MQLDVTEFARQIRKAGFSTSQVVAIAEALALAEVKVSGQDYTAHVFAFDFFRLHQLGPEFEKKAVSDSQPAGSFHTLNFHHWRDQLAATKGDCCPIGQGCDICSPASTNPKTPASK